MHCVDLWAAAIGGGGPPLPEAPEPGICAVIGDERQTIAARHLLGNTFTQWDLLARPDSDRVGTAAWAAWMYGHRAPGKKRDYRPERMSSWIVTPDRVTPLDRVAVRERVLAGGEGSAWSGYATTSYKKHGSMLAPVNAPGPGRWLWETIVVDCSNAQRVHALWSDLRAWQDAGIPRPVLETGDPEPHLIAKIGITRAQEFTRWARPLVSAVLYQFICYLLPSVAEMKGAQQEASDVGRNLKLF